jgi:hypothetical protein
MEWDTFQTIADKVFAFEQEVSVEFAGMGEPLLNPLVHRFIGYISNRAQTFLTTNASALTPPNTRRLIEAGLDRLTISFNGIDAESYGLMMGGLDFARAESALRSAIQLSQGQRMQVAANISVAKPLRACLPGIRDYLTRAGVQTIFFSQCHNRGGKLNDPAICDTPMPPAWTRTRCDIFASTIFVAWNGDILSSCHDLDGANRIGNLITDELGTVLSRRQQIAEMGVDWAICQRCNDMYRFMRASTPDSSPLSEWIYALYASEDKRAQKLTERIRELTAQIAAQEETINAQNAQIAEIYDSRGWRLLEFLRRVRLALAPKGSQRERFILGHAREG